MKRLILHVGPHKTGSSYLQKRLMLSRGLLDSSGFLYPEDFFFVFGHHLLCPALEKSVVVEQDLLSIETINKYDGDVIISSENFSVQPKSFFQKLKSLFAAEEILVVYVYRTSTDRLFSYWNEQIKHGSSQGFFEYSGPMFIRPYVSAELNHMIFLDMVSDVFGRDSLKIIDYNSVRKNGNACQDFFGALGCKSPVPDVSEDVNSMYLAENIEIIRQLNAMSRLDGRLLNERIRESYMRMVASGADCVKQAVECAGQFRSVLALGDTYIDRFVYEKINSQYSDLIFGELSLPCRSDKVFIQPEWVSSEKTRLIISDIYSEVFKSIN